MINVAIKQGWAGGPWHTRQFEQAAQAAGFNLTNVAHADVIVAHSMACYDLKAKTPAQYYILIDPPYWPGKSIVSRFIEKQRHDNRSLRAKYGWKYVMMSCLWGLVYIFAKPSYTRMALKNSGQLDFLNELKDKKVLIIRNEQDFICSPGIHIALSAYPHVFFRTTPGEHDDYYTNPQPYIDLIPKTL
jgi:hypothetical protein